MKKILGMLLAIFLVFGTAGSALAAFDLNGTFIVAYEEDESVAIQGINDQAGFESFFDLGNTAAFNTFVAGLTPGVSVDTNITLADFGTSSWDDVFVGIMGKQASSDFTYYFSADEAYEFNAISEAGFTSARNNIMNLFPDAGPANQVIDKAAISTYKLFAQQDGANPGSYGGPIQNAGNFGAEVNLAGIESGPITVGYFGGDLFADFIDPDGDFVGVFPQINTLDIFLDPTDGSLLVGSQVPVPGAVWLLGSGLLALVGIRRKNAK
jgi:hypothetical protein